MSEEKTFSHIPGESQLKEIGIYQYGFIATTDILFQEESPQNLPVKRAAANTENPGPVPLP